jgi:hypothetical protein
MYASRGYRTESTSIFSYSPNHLTFLVLVGEIAAGTVTLGTDSDGGLLADELYQEEIDTFRKRGEKFASYQNLLWIQSEAQKK